MTLQFEGVGFGTGTGSGGKIGTVVLVAMGSQPSTPYTVGSKWFYNGKIYTATSTSAHDSGVVPSYDTAYLFNGTYYYWDGSTLQGADESNLVHISGTETITGDKTFSGKADFQGETTVVTQPTSDSSQKAASTQFVKDYVQDGEWQKPADWIDIRSGAIYNSVYMLVGEGESTFLSKVSFSADLDNTSNNFKVFIDNVLYGTFQSGTTVALTWATLALTTGKAITTPISCTGHIIRVTPEVSTDKIASIHPTRMISSGTEQKPLFWIHFALDYKIAFRSASYPQYVSTYLVAITAMNDELYLSGLEGFLGNFYDLATSRTSKIAKIPTLKLDNITNMNGVFNHVGPLKKAKIVVDGTVTLTSASSPFKGNLRKIDINKPINCGNTSLFYESSLEELPVIDCSGLTDVNSFLTNNTHLKDTILDVSEATELKRIHTKGDTTHVMSGLKGLIVSSSAPFNHVTSPQINVSYTGMDRDALVALFNSMPTVTDSQEIDVTGTAGAADLTAEDLAIATGKGWTVTR